MSQQIVESTGGIPKPEPIQFTLTPDQVVYLMTRLPKGFSLQESKKMQRREKKDSVTKIPDSQLCEISLKDFNENLQKQAKRNRPKKVDRFMEPDPPRPKSKHILPSEKLSDEQTNKCTNYLQQLKKHPSSWPFLEPVNPVKLGIPDYFDIIREPMDLSTVQKNLKNYQYSTMNQFHADINKIWYNSYRYNQKGSDIYKLTTEMEKFYKKISTKGAEEAYPPVVYKKIPKDKVDKPAAPPKIPKPKPGQLSQMTITQKRELCQDIKKLPKEHLSGVWKIVASGRDGPNIELDVEKLEPEKLWKLYAYVREVNSRGIIAKKEQKKMPVEERHDYAMQDAPSAQSSFILDSESPP